MIAQQLKQKQTAKQITLPNDYIPNENEPYMNEFQIEFFRNQLVESREILQEELDNVNEEIHSSADVDVELSDKASREIILFSSIKRLSSIQNSINEIDDSLEVIAKKKYGFCRKTGQKIGVKRLMANPQAKFCVETQEHFEQEL